MIVNWHSLIFGLILSAEYVTKLLVFVGLWRKKKSPYVRTKGMLFLLSNAIGGMFITTIICLRQTTDNIISCNVLILCIYVFQCLYYLPFILIGVRFVILEYLFKTSNPDSVVDTRNLGRNSKSSGRNYFYAGKTCLMRKNFVILLFLFIVLLEFSIYFALIDKSEMYVTNTIQSVQSYTTIPNGAEKHHKKLVDYHKSDSNSLLLRSLKSISQEIGDEQPYSNESNNQNLGENNIQDSDNSEAVVVVENETNPAVTILEQQPANYYNDINNGDGDLGTIHTVITTVSTYTIMTPTSSEYTRENNYCFSSSTYTMLMIIFVIYGGALVILTILLMKSFEKLGTDKDIAKVMGIWVTNSALFLIYDMIGLPDEIYYYFPGCIIILFQILVCDYVIFINPLYRKTSQSRLSDISIGWNILDTDSNQDIELGDMSDGTPKLIQSVPIINPSTFIINETTRQKALESLQEEDNYSDNDRMSISMIIEWNDVKKTGSITLKSLLEFNSKYKTSLESLADKCGDNTLKADLLEVNMSIERRENPSPEICRNIYTETDKLMNVLCSGIDIKFASILRNPNIANVVTKLVKSNTDNVVISMI